MLTKQQLEVILEKLIKIYKSVYEENIQRIILYGSYARGDYSATSDVDFVALVDGERETLQQKLKQVWDKSSELEIECETILSPTVIPCDEFEKYRESLPYYKNIEREGIELYCRKMKLGEN